jgi:beta-glucosidase
LVHKLIKSSQILSRKIEHSFSLKIPDGKLEQHAKRLVGFAKTQLLEAGETQELVLELTKNSLSSFDTETACWIIEKGKYEVFVGNSVQNLKKCGEFYIEEDEIINQVENLMSPPVEFETLSKNNPAFPQGSHSGIKEDFTELTPKAVRKHYPEPERGIDDFVSQLSVEELARLSVCASRGWGMHEKGEAGRIYRLEKYDMPYFAVADGNNGVNIHKPNIGMPCSNTVCTKFNPKLAYEVGRVIADEAKENNIQMILAPAMNIHRNPLNGRHPEYFNEDQYLAGIMAGHQSKGLEENGVSSCIKHTVANNCESARKRNQSMITERALREIYLKVFEVAIGVHKPDSMMTGYNAVNGIFTAEDEEMIQGVFRGELGFEGFVMTDWNFYDTADVVSAIQAGNGWMTPGSTDNTYVTPIINGVHEGKIDIERLRSNVRYMLWLVQKRTGKNLGVL